MYGLTFIFKINKHADTVSCKNKKGKTYWFSLFSPQKYRKT